MRVLFDNDVVLDLILDRQPYVEVAAELFKRHEQGTIDAYISSITTINVFYITRKAKGVEAARRAVELLLTSLSVCSTNMTVLQNAQHLGFADYEDAVQCACAEYSHLDAIITRNLTDYKKATLPVLTPTDFLARLPAREEA